MRAMMPSAVQQFRNSPATARGVHTADLLYGSQLACLLRGAAASLLPGTRDEVR